MLRKLLKYEFLATARVFGVCYLGLAALSILAGLSMKFPATSNNIVGGLMLMAYVCMLAAVMLFTFLTIIRRFYKNLLGGEGYLMNTLPVRSWQLVTSKLIASLVWSAASLMMAALSFALLTIAAVPTFSLFWKDLATVWDGLTYLPAYFELTTGFSFWLFLLEVLLLLLVEGISSICLLYTSCMVGHQFRRWRVAASIIVYFLISFLVSALLDVLPGNASDQQIFALADNLSLAVNIQFWRLILVDVVLGTIYCAVTAYLLEKRLNLE